MVSFVLPVCLLVVITLLRSFQTAARRQDPYQRILVKVIRVAESFDIWILPVFAFFQVLVPATIFHDSSINCRGERRGLPRDTRPL
jgi:hypothetical protein